MQMEEKEELQADQLLKSIYGQTIREKNERNVCMSILK